MRLRTLSLALIAILVGACSSTKVITDYNPRTNFGSYQRFVMAENSGADKTISPFIVDNVKESFSRQLKSGMYQLAADPKQANFIARYYVTEAADTISRSPRLGLGLGSFGGNFGASTSVGIPLGKDTVNRNIQIVLDLLNAADHKLTWRGSLVIELNDSDPKANANNIERAVTDIWRQFPPH
jgi:hypothetical protein